MEDKYALLIDADNVSAKYIKPILDELSKYGNVTYKRIYGDWTSTYNSSWKEVLLENSITPIQQFSYTHGKNATDSAMIIDAMDMLYTSELEGFCLVSSDSDFTKLASRLRESGKNVIGMGEDKTPSSFRKACDIFTVLELLLEDNAIEKEEKPTIHTMEKGTKQDNADVVSKTQIEEAVVKIITENQNNDKITGLGEVGSRLVKLYPDFDVRRYGYSLLSKFLESFPKLKLQQEGTQVSVTLYEDKSKKEMLEEYVIQLVRNAGRQGVPLGTLSNKIRHRFGDFKVRDYGFPSSSSIYRVFRKSVSERKENRTGRFMMYKYPLLHINIYADALNMIFNAPAFLKRVTAYEIKIRFQIFLQYIQAFFSESVREFLINSF